MVIVKDIAVHASVRKLEWLMTGLMIHLGLILMGGQAFNGVHAFELLSSHLTELTWGRIFVVFGVIRLVVLILNGSHIRPAAEIRMVLSGISFVLFCVWVWGIQSAGLSIGGAVAYKWLTLGELLNVWQASSDLDKKRRSALKDGPGYTIMG